MATPHPNRDASHTTTTPAGESPAILDRIEGLVSYGRPTCDACRELAPEDRPDGGFSPDAPIRYIDNDETALYEWNARTLCQHHDTPGHIPQAATHRVRTKPEYIGDEHRMNTAYANHVVEIEEVRD